MRAWLEQLWERLRGARRAFTESHRTGALGEAVAAGFLTRKRGMAILARNWRSPRDRRFEIDIVCRGPGGMIVFVEVKTYPTVRIFQGYATVNRRKKALLKRAARDYLHGLGPLRRGLAYRFDIVMIERTEDDRLLPHHFENVPLFSKGMHL